MIFTIPKSKISRMEVIYNSGKKSMETLQKELGCQYMINTTLFNMNNFTPAGYLTVNGSVLGRVANPYGFAVNGKLIAFSYDNNVKYPDFTGCYHVLVRDGKIAISDSDSNKYGYTSRSAVGIKANGDVVFLCDQTNRSLKGIAGDLLAAGCTVALNYDGGGSSQCYTPTKVMRASRVVIAYLAIWTENTTVRPPKPENPDNEGADKPVGTTGYKVCIDPGHSSSESNGSPDGTYKEHEFALDLSNRIKKILERHGVSVIMTRSDGSYVGLTERAKISNDAGADLFVSIHTNAAGTGGSWTTATGWEIYVIALGGTAEKMAKKIHDETIAAVNPKDRGIKTANYAVLKYTDAPAVLIEHGFHDNKEDVALLKSSAYRDKLAIADAKGILSTLGIAYKAEDDTSTTPTPPDVDDWYQEGMDWAVGIGITDGSNPEAPVTREQLMTILLRYDKHIRKTI